MQSWKQKLASRKFWSAVVGVAVSLCALFGVGEMTAGQISGLISAVGVLIAYIFAESYVDGKNAESADKSDVEADK